MLRYAKVIDDKIKTCAVGDENGDIEFYKSIGMTEQNVEQAYNGSWYLIGYAPEKPKELIDQDELLELKQYLNETDWYYTRQLETGEAIPENVKQKRIESRNRINELEPQGTESPKNTTIETTTSTETESEN